MSPYSARAAVTGGSVIDQDAPMATPPVTLAHRQSWSVLRERYVVP